MRVAASSVVSSITSVWLWNLLDYWRTDRVVLPPLPIATGECSCECSCPVQGALATVVEGSWSLGAFAWFFVGTLAGTAVLQALRVARGFVLAVLGSLLLHSTGPTQAVEDSTPSTALAFVRTSPSTPSQRRHGSSGIADA